MSLYKFVERENLRYLINLVSGLTISNTMYNSTVYLKPEQVDKLRRVLTSTIPIYPSPPTSSFPTIHINPKDFLRQVYLKLLEHSIDISAIRLHGGAASYVLVNNSDFVYRDIDILFLVKTPLSSQQQTRLFSSNNEPYLCDVWTIIKYIISSCLVEHIPTGLTCTQYFISSVLDTYTKKNIQISSEQDSWGLLSLQNLLGRNLELKFVEHLKRQWQFSVDSFQIDLKPILFEKNRTQSSSSEYITTKIPTKTLVIEAINGLNILKKNQDIDDNSSTTPIQFGSLSPSLLSSINDSENSTQYRTLATITTIQASSNNNNDALSESGVNSSNRSEVAVEDDETDSPLQFQLSINEDIDDGIEADADDSTNEDDDQVFRTPIATDTALTTTDIPILSTDRIEVYSVYRNLHEALTHLNNKLIATYEPETMRGGGLLKYCDLLARNYKLYDPPIMFPMQRYMCSRFFIDYKTLPEQLHTIAQYVATHFLPSSFLSNSNLNNAYEILQRRYYQHSLLVNPNYDSRPIDQCDLINARLSLLFFEHLARVIHQNTVCLTHEDKQLLILNIRCLQDYYHFEYEYLFFGDSQHYQKYHVYNHHMPQPCTKSSSTSSRSSSPSNSSVKSYSYHRNGNSYRNQHHYHSQRQSGNFSYNGRRTYAEQQTVHRRNQS